MTAPMTTPTRTARVPGWSVRRLFGPKVGLPLMALGIAALIPGRLASLLPLLDAPASVAAAPDAAAPGLGAAGRSVLLREGILATPTVSAVLAGPMRANPLGANPIGEGRQADARLLAEVSRRQAETEQRERVVEVREARVNVAEALARTQIVALGKLRDELERLVVREGAAAEADIDALVALYVNMRPQQAAKILERLEAPRVATILLKIPERQAGPIMAQMDPQAALVVTQEIAGRREAFHR
jgi:flagellar motility protein MotE (MotC chaperone)